MAISFVGAAAANADTLTLPTHQAGDLIVLAVYRNASTLVPTIPNNWLAAMGGGGSSNWIGVFFIEATSSSMTSGTWTNADHLACAVYRPGSGKKLTLTRVSAVTTSTAGAGGSIGYGSIVGLGVPEDSWIVAVAGHRSNDTDIEVAPSGFVNRASTAGGSAGELVIHDSDGTETSISNPTYTLTVGTSSNFRAVDCQIAEYSVAASGGGASEHSFISIG